MTMQELTNRRVIIGKTSITCKDDHGKTCGIVRNVKAWSALAPREVFDIHKTVTASGIREAHLTDNIIVDGKTVYYLHDLGPLEAYEKHFSTLGISGDLNRYEQRKAIVKTAEAAGVIVVPCYLS